MIIICIMPDLPGSLRVKVSPEITLMLILAGIAKVLNLVLHKLTQRQVDAAELAFLAVDEQLVDVGDDLYDYEVGGARPVLPVLSRPLLTKGLRAVAWHSCQLLTLASCAAQDDVLRNSFNVYRGMLRDSMKLNGLGLPTVARILAQLTRDVVLAAYVHLYGLEAQRHLMLRILLLEQDHEHRLKSLPDAFRTAFEKRRQAASREPGSEKWVFPQAILNEERFRASVGSASDEES